MIEVIINPGQKKLFVPAGTLLLDVLKQSGIIISIPCGGNGSCGKCKVLVTAENILPESISSTERKWLSAEEIEKGFRLACQYHLHRNSTISIPSSSVTEEDHITIQRKSRSYLSNTEFTTLIPIKKVFLKLKPPTLKDQRSDWTRIKDKLTKNCKDGQTLKIPVDILKKLSQLLRENNYCVTAVLYKNHVIAMEAGNTTKELYGVAFDIGTTTIAGFLLNLASSKEIAAEALTNPQCIYGADVISRIDFAKKDFRNRQKMQQELIVTLNQMISSLMISASSSKGVIDITKIYFAVLVGNTCMQHFLWSLPTENLALSPFVPVVTDSILQDSMDLQNFCLMPHAKLYSPPSLSAYIGGDIVADLIDISVWQKKGITLMIDLGTNGEIILVHKGKVWACSTAAGPAFEGARISSGMRATVGAIDRIYITKQTLIYHTIGHSLAAGICGSGIAELIAELLKLGIILPNGRLVNRDECPKNICKNIIERIIKDENYNQFLVVPREKSFTGFPIYLTQKDVREIQLAKGAVMAGIRILLKKAKILSGDIEEILLAGSFGNVLNAKTALRIGIIPAIPMERIRSIGNAAGRGAEKLLLSEDLRERAEGLSKIVQYIELSSDRDFQKIFTESLFFGEHPF